MSAVAEALRARDSSPASRLGLEENGYVLRIVCLLRPSGPETRGRPRGPASRKRPMTVRNLPAPRPWRLQPRGRPRGPASRPGLEAKTIGVAHFPAPRPGSRPAWRPGLQEKTHGVAQVPAPRPSWRPASRPRVDENINDGAHCPAPRHPRLQPRGRPRGLASRKRPMTLRNFCCS